MKVAKIISAIGGILYALFFLGYTLIAFKLSSLYRDLDINYSTTSLIIGLLIPISLATANFGYLYYLKTKEVKNQEVKNAIVFSSLIAFGPLIFYPVITVISIILPIYNITSAF